MGLVFQARIVARKVFYGWGLAVAQRRSKQQQCLKAMKHFDDHLLHKVHPEYACSDVTSSAVKLYNAAGHKTSSCCKSLLTLTSLGTS